jgi:hypothetical protein
MRTNQWLADRLHSLHAQYFAEVPIKNTIYVKFGRSARTRLGSIIAKPKKGHALPVSYITINSLFKDETVPDYVIDATLAHEFVHYTHGFHSPLEQLYEYPHRGDIVNKELRKRGAGELLHQQTVWLKHEYREFLRKHHML